MTDNLPTELKQRYLNERREFCLLPERVRILVKDTDGESEAFIEYEDITSTTRHRVQQDGKLYIAAISFAIFSVVGLAANAAGVSSLMQWVPLWIIATPILFAFHFAKRRRYLLVDLANDKSIFFLYNKPSKQALSNFLQAMQEARKKYLRKAYYVINPNNDPQSELDKLQWLLDQEAITEAEFKEHSAALISPDDSEGQYSNPQQNDTRLH